jgi:hypothetical protein
MSHLNRGRSIAEILASMTQESRNAATSVGALYFQLPRAQTELSATAMVEREVEVKNPEEVERLQLQLHQAKEDLARLSEAIQPATVAAEAVDAAVADRERELEEAQRRNKEIEDAVRWEVDGGAGDWGRSW